MSDHHRTALFLSPSPLSPNLFSAPWCRPRLSSSPAVPPVPSSTIAQVFIEEERENELEQIFEQSLDKKQDKLEAEEEEAANLGLEGPSEATNAGRRTIESVKGAERVLEALKTLSEEAERQEEYRAAKEAWEQKRDRMQRAAAEAAKVGGAAAASAKAAAEEAAAKPPVLVPNMLLLGLDEGGYLLKALSSVRSTELEQALLLLPFESARDLLTRLLPLLPRAPPAELMARCSLFLLKVHHKQIVATRNMRPLLHKFDDALRTRLTVEQGALGYNLAAMRFVKNAIEQSDAGRFFESALDEKIKEKAANAVGGLSELRRKTAARAKKGSKRSRNG